MKSILVPSIGHANVALDAGLAVARLFDAHLECLRVHPDPVELAVKAAGGGIGAEAGGSMVVADLWKILAEEDRTQTENTRKAFDALCRREAIARDDASGVAATRRDHVTASWQERTGEEINETIMSGRLHDLIVLDGQVDGGHSVRTIGIILHGCGRPVLLAGRPRPTIARNVVIAWKNAPEAARAVTAAMPLLAKAERILVASATENGRSVRNATESVDGIVKLLQRHGLPAEGRCIPTGERAPVTAITAIAMEQKADLLVMGAYGHSRMREMVFGGFTRHVLSGIPIPVFMQH